MVAIDVAMAIFTARSGDTPRPDRMMVMNGTIIMPPPMPSRPARKPVVSPSRPSSRISESSTFMMGRRRKDNRQPQGWRWKKVSAMPPDRHPEPGFRWARAT